MGKHPIESDYILVQIPELAELLSLWVDAGRLAKDLRVLCEFLLTKREQRVICGERTSPRNDSLPTRHQDFLLKLGLPGKAHHNWIRIPRYLLKQLYEKPLYAQAVVIFSVYAKFIKRRGYSRASYRQMAEAFGISRFPIFQAVRDLEFEGLLVRDKGLGREHWLRWAFGSKYYLVAPISDDAQAHHWKKDLDEGIYLH